MAYNIPSMYKPVWDKIKNEGRAELIVPTPLISRVRKAVIDAKNKDRGFKLLNEIERVSLKITVLAAPQHEGCSLLVFVRREKFGISNLEGVGV